MVWLGSQLISLLFAFRAAYLRGLIFLLMSPLLVEDYLEVNYRADLDLLIARWLIPIELPRMRQGYQLLLEAARAGNYRHWILDVRRYLNTPPVGA